MSQYRVYFVSSDDHYLGPAQIIECDNDEQACFKAQQIAIGCGIELWEGARFVARFALNAPK